MFFLGTGAIAWAEVAYVPPPLGHVNDYASLFSEQFTENLEERLNSYKGKTRTQIAVLTVDSLKGESVDDFARDVYAEWAIGDKYKENGVLILLSKDEQLVRIEYGPGLAGYLTAERTEAVAEEIIEPALESEAYEEGMLSAVNALEEYIGGLPAAPVFSETEVVPLDGVLLVFGFILVRILFGGLVGAMEVTRDARLGGIFGLAAGLFLNLGIGEPTPRYILTFAGVFALVGLTLDWALSRHIFHRASFGRAFHPIFGGIRKPRRL